MKVKFKHNYSLCTAEVEGDKITVNFQMRIFSIEEALPPLQETIMSAITKTQENVTKTIETMTFDQLVEFHSDELFFDEEQMEKARPIVEGYFRSLLEDCKIQDYADEYGEPGYQNEGKVILLGNWNNFDKYTLDLLEEFYELEWEDEWIVICDKAYRNSPDCYDWKPSFYMSEHGEYYTEEDMDRDTVIELFGITSHYRTAKAIPFDLDLHELGFTMVNEDSFESGWYGTNDDPQKIIDKLFEDGSNNDKVYVFTYSSEQFRVNFDLWETVEG